MAPDMVQPMAGLGRRWGWDFVVMYGQTEATARMAYLPADLAPRSSRPRRGAGAGRVVRDPRVRRRSARAGGVGEVVYRGPNVMMGYAESAGDLARGPSSTS